MTVNFNFVDDYIPESLEVDLDKLKTSQLFRKKRYLDAIFFGDV